MNEAQRAAWEALGLGPLWRLRESHRGVGESCAAPVSSGSPGPAVAGGQTGRDPVPRMDWDALRAAVSACEACALSRGRTQTVFGVGPTSAPWMLIGEAPGAEEDARGEPFVGQAGRLLDNMLSAIGLSRSRDVFIANVLKCRPPRNRDPLPEEVARCEPFLARQIELLSPRIIVVMGRFAAQSLLRTDASIASLRGRLHGYQLPGRLVPVVVTYHPAYLLRNLGDKAKAWSDLCLARDCFARSGDASESDPPAPVGS